MRKSRWEPAIYRGHNLLLLDRQGRETWRDGSWGTVIQRGCYSWGHGPTVEEGRGSSAEEVCVAV